MLDLADDETFGPPEESSAEAVLSTVRRWLDFVAERAQRQEGALEGAVLLDHAGFLLEDALELFAASASEGAGHVLEGSMLLTRRLPDGAPRALGPVGWIMSVRAGEDLDLSLLGGSEWSTLHLDFFAANPVMNWASEATAEGRQMLRRLMQSAAKAGRAITVAPLSEQVKEQFRALGFQEDSLLDPTLMFWVPSEEGLSSLHGEHPHLAYGGP